MDRTGPEPLRRVELALYVVAIAVPAFLIFLVQPMVGKRILPWFGGAPGVWAVCLAFYQTTLFAGYAYAHGLIRLASPSWQVVVHAAVVAVAVLGPGVLPWPRPEAIDAAAPIPQILGLLVWHVAAPFAVLAATGPLVQVWFARRHPERSPYPLYAVSNAGSMAALLAFPFLIEPHLGLDRVGRLWSAAFVGAMALVLVVAALARRPGARPGGAKPSVDPGADTRVPPEVTPGLVLLWIGLAAAAVIVLNGITNRLCLDIASVPFLWIVPLAAYLLTFIVCFSSQRTYARAPFFGLLIVLLAVSAVELLFSDRNEIAGQAGLLIRFGSLPAIVAYYTALLFVLCTIAHGELYRLRPRTESLTAFYLCVSGGGALGGLFVGIAAPSLFDGYAEYAWGLVGVVVLAGIAGARASRGLETEVRRSRPVVRVAVVVGVALVAFDLAQALRPSPAQSHQERNFFGVLRVIEQGEGPHASKTLMHGSTLHGAQFQSRRGRALPTSYYGPASSLAAALATRPGEPPARVGIVGLGVGTIAAYGRPGERFRFYEIDPAVVRIARDDGTFHFLADSAAQVEVRVGDARRRLEDEQQESGSQGFDVLVIDAFTSDAVPVHLMTAEAFAVYRDALAEQGLLAVHVSNRHFQLRRLVAKLGRAVGLAHLHVQTKDVPARQTHRSRWVFLARDPERLARIEGSSRVVSERLGLAPGTHRFARTPEDVLEATPLFTDDYSDLFGLLAWDD